MLELPTVTLCCIDTANHQLALRALALSSAGIRFGRALFATDALPADCPAPPGIDVVAIAPLRSRDEYSRFVLKDLCSHIATEHVLLVQWDGYVINPAAWDDAFLRCDYLGAKCQISRRNGQMSLPSHASTYSHTARPCFSQ